MSCRYTTIPVTFVVHDSVCCFEGYGRRVTVFDKVASVWRGHRQIETTAVESFGVLMGTTSVDRREIWIQAATTPMPGDQCSRFSFKLLDPGHQRAVCRMFATSGGKAIYLGTWHTHPQPVSEPSDLDLNDWLACLRVNRRRPLAFVLVGTKAVRVFVRNRGRFRSLRPDWESDDID